MPRRSSRSPLSPLRRQLALVVLAASATACASPRTRPVLDVVPDFTRAEISVGSDALALVPSLDADEAPAETTPTAAAVFHDAVEDAARQHEERRGGFDLDGISGAQGPLQLDPDLGPIDLGLALHVNLGAGEAPYDDAVRSIHAVTPGRPGFSDSVLQFSYRERMGETYGIHGTAALTRFQDLAILDGIADAEFAFFVLGVHASF